MKSYSAVFLFVGLLTITTHVKTVSCVTGGADAPAGKFPYMAMIRDSNGQYLCGASIIDKKYLLTAASCVYRLNPRNLEVVVGTNKFNGEGGDRYSVKYIDIHAEHQRMKEGHSVNDLALVELKGEIQFNDKVKPVKLPTAQTSISANTRVTLIGFGDTGNSGSHPDVLRFVETEIMDHTDCGLTWLSTRLILIGEGQICTKPHRQIGACSGDSGSPLVNEDGVQIGIVSFGYHCAMAVPDVYTSLAYYTDDIKKMMET